MKKFLCMFLAIMLLCSTTVAFAYNAQPISPVNDGTVSKVSIDVSDIPIYITAITDNSLSIKNTANNVIKNNLLNENNQLSMKSTDYNIKKLSVAEKREILDNPMYKDTLLRVEEMIKQGVKVNYINYFMKAKHTTKGDNNDPEYWEENCEYLGTYDGYKFLYLESSSNVESSWVTPDNMSTSISWTSLASAAFKAYIYFGVGGVYSKVLTILGSLQDFFNSVQSPLKVTYSESGGYIKFKVSGNLYYRTVIIRDKNNRVEGHAYYPWGSTEQTKLNTKLDAKWPTSERPGGEYNYDTDTHTYPKRTNSTPGFYGNSTLYKKIIALYENEHGYFTHNENIDVNRLIVDMLS